VKSTLIFALSLVVVSSFNVRNALAVDAADPYFTFGEPEIQEIADDASMTIAPMVSPDGDWLGDLNEANVAIDQIINMGKKVWDIVEANRPVVNIQTDTANALPRGVETWQSLQGWQVPTSKVFRISYKNGFGSKVVDFSYRVLYTHGGNVNGKGAYLTNVTVIPANLEVLWGYTFNMKASVPSVTNVGTMSSPVGAAQMLIEWKVDTAVKHSQRTASYYMQGDGVFKDLSAGN
jgi:hypothetical protein